VREAGGEVRTASAVRRVRVERGRATGVELETGELVRAREAVVANVGPSVLFDGLVERDALPERFRRQIAAYAYGPATMMLHAAVDGSVPWEAGGDLHEFGYVHLGPYVEDMARTYADAVGGRLPASPLLVVGQTSAIDPTRAPEGGTVLWIQVRMLPSRIRDDALGEIAMRDWAQAKAPYAERVLGKLETYAPGVRERILDVAVVGPDDLERANPNLVGGDSLGGSHHLDQNLLLRPAAGWWGYRTPIDRLLMVGSATWPGAGVNAVSGRLVARMVLQAKRRDRRAAAAGAGAAAALSAAAWRRARR
jgi:phytoene dehydrogenase-like protein